MNNLKKKQSEYSKYVTDHMQAVKLVWETTKPILFPAGLTSHDYNQRDGIEKLIKVHDKSKLTKLEFDGYQKNFFPENSVKDTDKIAPEVLDGSYTNYCKGGGGQIPPRIYEGLYSLFKCEKFDADELAQMAVDAGAGYIIFVTKHHDGFCMWDSAYTDYDMMSTPAKRDLCKELADACHKRGVRILWYYSKVDYHSPTNETNHPRFFYLFNIEFPAKKSL